MKDSIKVFEIGENDDITILATKNKEGQNNFLNSLKLPENYLLQ
jgi:hypothetical protein